MVSPQTIFTYPFHQMKATSLTNNNNKLTFSQVGCHNVSLHSTQVSKLVEPVLPTFTNPFYTYM